MSSGNVDTENAAEALREVLSVDELQYYSKMAGNMITFGSTGISGLEEIKKALDSATTLSD